MKIFFVFDRFHCQKLGQYVHPFGPVTVFHAISLLYVESSMFTEQSVLKVSVLLNNMKYMDWYDLHLSVWCTGSTAPAEMHC